MEIAFSADQIDGNEELHMEYRNLARNSWSLYQKRISLKIIFKPSEPTGYGEVIMNSKLYVTLST